MTLWTTLPAISPRVRITALMLLAALAPAVGLAQMRTDIERHDFALTKGLVEFKRGQYRQAEQLFLEALTANPSSPEARYHLGQTQIRLGQYETAKRTFQTLLEAQPESGRAHLGMGITLYYEGRYGDALSSLALAEHRLPQNGLVYFYQGLSHQKLGMFDRSVRPLVAAGRLAPDLAAEVQYLLGLAYYKQGLAAEAREEFEQVLRKAPGSVLASSAGELLRVLTEAATATGARRRWTISAGISGQYDSNVVLLPLGIQPPGGPAGISRKSDYRSVLQLAAEFLPLQTDRSAAGMGYALYQSFHRTLHAFDVQDHSPSLFVAHRLGRVEARLQYSFDYVTVGRSPFLMAHTAQNIVRIHEGGGAITEVQLRYQSKDFQDDRFPINAFRDGKNWLAGATQYFVFPADSGHIRFGYTYDTDRTGGGSPTLATPGAPSNADWAYVGHRLSAGMEFLLFSKTRFDAGVEYYRQNYLNPNSFSLSGTQRRGDDIYILSGTVTRELRPWLSALFQYGYTRDHSNVSVFDYTRNVFSVSLLGKF
jgi:tetratricopeptide (TPR) repeat protein